jgi:hypothetical protein
MKLKLSLTAAALAAMSLGGCKTTMPGPSGASGGAAESENRPANAKADEAKKGECWGVNACKGQGACGGVGHECSGQNACKGQGWLSLTKPECDAKNGKFKAA